MAFSTAPNANFLFPTPCPEYADPNIPPCPINNHRNPMNDLMHDMPKNMEPLPPRFRDEYPTTYEYYNNYHLHYVISRQLGCDHHVVHTLGAILRETRADWNQVVLMMSLQKNQLEAVVKMVEDGCLMATSISAGDREDAFSSSEWGALCTMGVSEIMYGPGIVPTSNPRPPERDNYTEKPRLRDTESCIISGLQQAECAHIIPSKVCRTTGYHTTRYWVAMAILLGAATTHAKVGALVVGAANSTRKGDEPYNIIMLNNLLHALFDRGVLAIVMWEQQAMDNQDTFFTILPINHGEAWKYFPQIWVEDHYGRLGGPWIHQKYPSAAEAPLATLLRAQETMLRMRTIRRIGSSIHIGGIMEQNLRRDALINGGPEYVCFDRF